jgi:hypothetical protein
VNLNVNPAISEATRHFADQLGLSLAQLAFGVFGALIVILAGTLWRRARADALDKKV